MPGLPFRRKGNPESSPGLVFPGREGIFCGFQGEAGYAFCAGLAYIMLCKLSCVGSSYEPCIV